MTDDVSIQPVPEEEEEGGNETLIVWDCSLKEVENGFLLEDADGYLYIMPKITDVLAFIKDMYESIKEDDVTIQPVPKA